MTVNKVKITNNKKQTSCSYWKSKKTLGRLLRSVVGSCYVFLLLFKVGEFLKAYLCFFPLRKEELAVNCRSSSFNQIYYTKNLVKTYLTSGNFCDEFQNHSSTFWPQCSSEKVQPQHILWRYAYLRIFSPFFIHPPAN